MPKGTCFFDTIAIDVTKFFHPKFSMATFCDIALWLQETYRGNIVQMFPQISSNWPDCNCNVYCQPSCRQFYCLNSPPSAFCAQKFLLHRVMLAHAHTHAHAHARTHAHTHLSRLYRATSIALQLRVITCETISNFATHCYRQKRFCSST
jgi:hypothetical protein